MLTEDLLEQQFVLYETYQASIDQLLNIQISESQMHHIKQLCKITSVISDNEAIEIYQKQQSLKQISKWRKEETQLYLWIMVKLYFQKEFSFSKIPHNIWDQVGLYISKSPLQLQKKWQEYTLSSVSPFKQWTVEEDKVLIQLVSHHKQLGTKIPWNRIGIEFNEQIHETFRTGKKCRDRYLNILDPSIKKKKWKDEDIYQLFQLVAKYGKKWLQISGLTQRTENIVKNKYYGLVKKYKTLDIAIMISKNSIQYKQKLQHKKEQSMSDNIQQNFFEEEIMITYDFKYHVQFEQEKFQYQDNFLIKKPSIDFII